MSCGEQWENKTQMMSFLRNFLDLDKNVDSSPASTFPMQTPTFDEICQKSLQKQEPAPKLSRDKQTADALEVSQLTKVSYAQQQTKLTSQTVPSFLLHDSHHNQKMKKTEPAIVQHLQTRFDDHFLNPFAFGEPMESTLNVPLPVTKKEIQKPRDVAVKDLDSFSPFAFQDLSPYEFVNKADKFSLNSVIADEDSSRSKIRHHQDAASTRPQKKIRTTFYVAETAQSTENKETVLKREPQTVSKEAPVKIARKRKNNRERQRRQCLNQKFQDLIEVLAPQNERQRLLKVGVGSKGPKWNKHDILSEAIYSIKNLRLRLNNVEARLAELGK